MRSTSNIALIHSNIPTNHVVSRITTYGISIWIFWTFYSLLHRQIYVIFVILLPHKTENAMTISNRIIDYTTEFFDDIDNLAELFWNIEDSKTTPKYNLTQFSLHYQFIFYCWTSLYLFQMILNSLLPFWIGYYLERNVEWALSSYLYTIIYQIPIIYR